MPPTIRLFVRVGGRGSRLRAWARFPADATPAAIRAWREDARSKLRMAAPAPAEGFTKDAAKYLSTVTSMPTYPERVRDIGLWVTEFGSTPRDKIASADIRAVRERWLTVGPRLIQKWIDNPAGRHKIKTFVAVPGPLSPSTVNHRLRALENFYTVMNGRHGANPVRDVPEVREPDGPPREIPPNLIAQILWTMEDSKTRARIAVMLETGLPHAALARATEADFDAAAKTLWVPGRKKGAGTAGRLMPLTTRAVAALKALNQWDAWGSFSRSSLRKSFLRAARKAGVMTGLRVYDVRHTAASRTLRSSGGNLWATQLLMGHAAAKTTERYARSAIDPALVAAVAAIEQAQQPAVAQPVPPIGKKGPKGPIRARGKRRKP